LRCLLNSQSLALCVFQKAQLPHNGLTLEVCEFAQRKKIFVGKKWKQLIFWGLVEEKNLLPGSTGILPARTQKLWTKS